MGWKLTKPNKLKQKSFRVNHKLPTWPSHKEIGNILCRIREELGMTQQEVAEQKQIGRP